MIDEELIDNEEGQSSEIIIEQTVITTTTIVSTVSDIQNKIDFIDREIATLQSHKNELLALIGK